MLDHGIEVLGHWKPGGTWVQEFDGTGITEPRNAYFHSWGVVVGPSGRVMHQPVLMTLQILYVNHVTRGHLMHVIFRV